MRSRHEIEGGSTEEERTRASQPAPPPPHAALLRMQRDAGNAAVARMLMREPATGAAAPAVVETPIQTGAGKGMVMGGDPTPVHQHADAASKQVGTLTPGTMVDLLAEAGEFYSVEFPGGAGYVERGRLSTAIDSPSDAQKAEWKARETEFAGRAGTALEALKSRPKGQPLRGGGTAPADTGAAFPAWFSELQRELSFCSDWTAVEEHAQQVLDDYARFYVETRYGGTIPRSLQILFEYIGRSSVNQASAAKGGRQSVSVFGGGIKADKTPTKNWCTQTSTAGVLRALREMGFAPANGDGWWEEVLRMKTASGGATKIGAPQAYTARLKPGDLVMYLFDGCQYGGHTVTALDDNGDSFTHISGNTGDAISVGIGEARRLKRPPRPRGGQKGDFSLHKCNRTLTPEERTESTNYIKQWDFEGAKLVYSIVRFGDILAELEPLPFLEPKDQDAILDRFKLKRVTPAADLRGGVAPEPPGTATPAATPTTAEAEREALP